MMKTERMSCTLTYVFFSFPFFCPQIDLGNDKYAHVRAYRSFAGETSLRAVQPDKALLDEIEYFDIQG